MLLDRPEPRLIYNFWFTGVYGVGCRGYAARIKEEKKQDNYRLLLINFGYIIDSSEKKSYRIILLSLNNDDLFQTMTKYKWLSFNKNGVQCQKAKRVLYTSTPIGSCPPFRFGRDCLLIFFFVDIRHVCTHNTRQKKTEFCRHRSFVCSANTCTDLSKKQEDMSRGLLHWHFDKLSYVCELQELSW